MRATTRPTRRRPVAWTALILAGALVSGVLVAGGATSSATAVPAPVAAKKDEAAAPAFRVSSFNILGWRHTAKGGKHAAMDSGEVRMERTLKLLDRKAISVAGLQEMQPQQYTRLKQVAGSDWRAYPADRLSRYAMHNSIIWRASDWKVVQRNTIDIPYFNGELVPMPYVLLRHRTTHRMVWFANFHNPADGRGRPSQAKWRKQAKARQVALPNELWETGLPLVLTGDMNERDSYFCAMAGLAPMQSASGGSASSTSCAPPPNSRIDWIFGSDDLRFSGYTVVDGRLVNRTSDHPMFYSTVEIPGRPQS